MSGGEERSCWAPMLGVSVGSFTAKGDGRAGRKGLTMSFRAARNLPTSRQESPGEGPRAFARLSEGP